MATRAASTGQPARRPRRTPRHAAETAPGTRHVMHRDALTDAAEANPLRVGTRLERVPDPCLVVIFGATGDLAHRKILPAFYNLRRAGLLPPETSIVGFARRPYSDADFRAEMRAVGGGALAQPGRAGPLGRLRAPASTTSRATSRTPPAYARLAERLDQIDAAAGCRGNRLFYLATPPCAYEDIVANLGAAGLDQPRGRLVAHRHREALRPRPGVRPPPQRRGHERLRRVAGLPHRPLPGQGHRPQPARLPLRQRHLRAGLEPALRGPRADHRGRGPRRRGPRRFYEEAGASRDILQNHMLQLLSLVAMEPPIDFEADALRDEKVRVLRAVDTGLDAGPRARRRGARPVRGGLGRRPQGASATARSRTSRRDSQRRDLRGPAPRGRELALGRRALLPAHRQAPAAARHGDRGPVQAAAADALPGERLRPRAQPAGHAHPARRGHPAALRGQGARAGPRRAQREHGLHLRLDVPDATPRRPTRRCSSTPCSATPRCSPAPTRWRPPGASSRRSCEMWRDWGEGGGESAGRRARRRKAPVGKLDGSLQPYEAGTWGPEAADRLLERTAGDGDACRRPSPSTRRGTWRWYARTDSIRGTTRGPLAALGPRGPGGRATAEALRDEEAAASGPRRPAPGRRTCPATRTASGCAPARAS